MEMEEIQGAVARGWCSPENEKKVMDVDLAKAISIEVEKLFMADKNPQLGCATTEQLLDEMDDVVQVLVVDVAVLKTAIDANNAAIDTLIDRLQRRRELIRLTSKQ